MSGLLALGDDAVAALLHEEFTFAPADGEAFVVSLVAVDRTYRALSLDFRTTAGTAPSQQTFLVSHPAAGAGPLFCVPVAGDGAGWTYQAVISRDPEEP